MYKKQVEELLLWFELVDLWDRISNKEKISASNTYTDIEGAKAPGYNTTEISSEESSTSAGN